MSPFKHFICSLIFRCAGSSLLHGLFSSCREQGLLSSRHAQRLSSFPLRRLPLFRSKGSRTCSARAQELHLLGSGALAQELGQVSLGAPRAGRASRTRNRAVSPALAGGLITTNHQGSPSSVTFNQSLALTL